MHSEYLMGAGKKFQNSAYKFYDNTNLEKHISWFVRTIFILLNNNEKSVGFFHYNKLLYLLTIN